MTTPGHPADIEFSVDHDTDRDPLTMHVEIEGRDEPVAMLHCNGVDCWYWNPDPDAPWRACGSTPCRSTPRKPPGFTRPPESPVFGRFELRDRPRRPSASICGPDPRPCDPQHLRNPADPRRRTTQSPRPKGALPTRTGCEPASPGRSQASCDITPPRGPQYTGSRPGRPRGEHQVPFDSSACAYSRSRSAMSSCRRCSSRRPQTWRSSSSSAIPWRAVWMTS